MDLMKAQKLKQSSAAWLDQMEVSFAGPGF